MTARTRGSWYSKKMMSISCESSRPVGVGELMKGGKSSAFKARTGE